MTYSVELFICIVVGLVLGHAIFNSSMYLWWTECPLRIAHSWYLDVRRCRWRECGSLLRLANHSDQSAARGGPAHVGFTITVTHIRHTLFDHCEQLMFPLKRERKECPSHKSENVRLSKVCSKEICYENGNFMKAGKRQTWVDKGRLEYSWGR